MVGRALSLPCAPHLVSAFIACALPISILFGGRVMAGYLERQTIHRTAPRDFFIKNQGLAFQRVAARTPDILLLYGSSELLDPVPNRASDFFSTSPSGFQVCPVGKAGTTSLVILQKIGALGTAIRDRKVAISLSPSWFFAPAIDPYAYAGNFSLPAASGILFGSALDSGLKAQIARRMLEFPDTLAKSALLQLDAACLASGKPWDRILLMFIEPLGKLQNAVLDLQDHFEALVYIVGGGKGIRQYEAQGLRPGKAAAKAGREAAPSEISSLETSTEDASFRARIAAGEEWSDLELLFRTLTELGARPFIITMPIEGSFYDARGVSRPARQLYYDKITELAQRHHFPCIQFPDRNADSDFVMARREHPTPAGWLYYDRALDDFFHDANGKNEERPSLR